MELFFFKSKVDGAKWLKCYDEASCRKMAAAGYEVKKMVYPDMPEPEKPNLSDGVGSVVVDQGIHFYRMD